MAKKKWGKFLTPFLPYILLGVGVIFLLKPLKEAWGKIFGFVGLNDTKETQEIDKVVQSVSPSSPWSAQYYKKVGGTLMNRASAEKLAQYIYDSFAWNNDDEDKCIAAFKQLKTKAQLSFLVEVFYQKYGVDLLTYLRGGIWPSDRLSDAELKIITDYINKLP